MRGATIPCEKAFHQPSISIHAPLAGCDTSRQGRFFYAKISIHAPLAGCDIFSVVQTDHFFHFNPRTPCGVRLVCLAIRCYLLNFNPRTPCGVRLCFDRLSRWLKDFNPRTPCGVRPSVVSYSPRATEVISIHAPLAGCDQYSFSMLGIRRMPKFQSTHPLRGATAKMHKIFCAFCDNRQFYRVSPSGVPSVGALFTYSRGLQRAGAGANLPVNGCALGLRAKSSASPQAGRSACSRSVRFYSRTSCRGNKTAGCRVPDP